MTVKDLKKYKKHFTDPSFFEDVTKMVYEKLLREAQLQRNSRARGHSESSVLTEQIARSNVKFIGGNG
ncbi:MAG: hypothetical protein O3A01_04460 [bacterium]|nr:hypothetical protein [bacterium]